MYEMYLSYMSSEYVLIMSSMQSALIRAIKVDVGFILNTIIIIIIIVIVIIIKGNESIVSRYIWSRTIVIGYDIEIFTCGLINYPLLTTC